MSTVVIVIILVSDGTFVAVGCYSLFYKPKVEITCERDTHILIHGVFFGAREIDICPESGFVEKGSESCCEPKCDDCYTYGGHGEVNNLLRECTFQQNCSVYTHRSVMTDCGAKSFSAYMAVHYQCTQTGKPSLPVVSIFSLSYSACQHIWWQSLCHLDTENENEESSIIQYDTKYISL